MSYPAPSNPRIPAAPPSFLAKVMMAAAAAVVVLACSGAAHAQNLTADYRFEGTRTSSVGAAPALGAFGTNTFATETVDGVSRTVLQFPMNSGLSLAPTTGVLPTGRYTIVLLFRFQQVSGFRRVLDFRNGTSDNGAYIQDGHLEHSNGSDDIPPNTYVQVVYTRDGSTASQRAYVDGQVAVDGSDPDTSDLALEGTALRFFRDDDTENGNEASAGAVARIRIYDGPLGPSEVAALDRLPAPGGDVTADLAVAFEELAPAAGSGSLYDISMRITNLSAPDPAGADAAENVVVTTPTPAGTVFASAESDRGECTGPPIGEAGAVVCALGSLAPGESVSVTVVVDVTANPGALLATTATVTSAANDPDPSNNAATLAVPVQTSGAAELAWEAPEPSTNAAPLPPPQKLVVTTAGQRGGAARSFLRTELLGYNVYRSNKPGVTPSPGNLFTSVPASQTTVAAPVAPSGTFFVITAVYDAGESGPSNEGSAGVEAGTITKVKVSATKITVTGSGFSDAVTVFVDGIPFVSEAAVKKNNTKVVQKGALLTGQTARQYLAAHPSILIGVRNSNGGVATRRYPQ